jgi:hypothetical protein
VHVRDGASTGSTAEAVAPLLMLPLGLALRRSPNRDARLRTSDDQINLLRGAESGAAAPDASARGATRRARVGRGRGDTYLLVGVGASPPPRARWALLHTRSAAEAPPSRRGARGGRLDALRAPSPRARPRVRERDSVTPAARRDLADRQHALRVGARARRGEPQPAALHWLTAVQQTSAPPRPTLGRSADAAGTPAGADGRRPAARRRRPPASTGRAPSASSARRSTSRR